VAVGGSGVALGALRGVALAEATVAGSAVGVGEDGIAVGALSACALTGVGRSSACGIKF
jgi:hypothetical protein